MLEKVAGLKVLVTDDNAVNQMVARRILECWHCQVYTADDGYEAVEIVKRLRFDVVLMDCMMPVLDGYGAARAIRRLDGPARDVPIIALTANAMSEDHELCLEAGMNGVVTKPINKDALLKSLIEFVVTPGAAANVGDKRSVLFVDDEVSVLSGLRRVLRRQTRSWNLYFAAGYEEALEVLDAHPIEAVISDILMPERDGFDLLEAMAADGRWRDIPVILMTGSDDPSLHDKGLQRGAKLVIWKPVGIDTLMEQLSIIWAAQ